MLPNSLAGPHRFGGRMPEFLRRVMHHDQMETDSALSQMWSLIASPSLVYKFSKARKMTKNHYYRDDPAFVVIQCFFLAVATICFGLALQASFLRIAYNVLYQVGINYIVLGSLIATATWVFANKVLMGSGQLHEVRRDVEWQYAFDIHCNSYFPFFMLVHVAQFLLLPILVQDSAIAQIISNVLYCLAGSVYVYVTFCGYLELPMLCRQQILLYPIAGIVALAVLATVATHVNMTHFTIHHWWSAPPA